VIQLTGETQPSSSASLLSDGTQPRGGPVSASRVWAARRCSRPITLSSVRNDAATNISSAASMQEKYSETMQQMMRIQHAAKMANLALEAQLLRKQLGAEEE